MRINSGYSTLTHSPLVLLQQDISYAQFLALLSVAEVFMATNLREGMNLTSHDFIHCQDGELANQQYGSLILSEFTGSARIFQGHPLLVNPWDYKQCADAINTALELPTEQKKLNWEFLLARKSPYTALAWYSSLQSALKEAHSMQRSRDAHTISPVDIFALQKSYNASQCRLFFLEDGALFNSTQLSSFTATDILQALALDSNNTIYLTSNHSPDQLKALTQHLPSRIGLIAENGCFLKPPHGTWTPLVNVDGTRNWRAGIRKVIEYFHERTEGSVISERRCSLTFHYDAALDADTAAHQASELADQINGARGSEAICVVRDTTAVSVEPLHVSKAGAAAKIIESAEKDPDFVFVAGGARGDEALFRWANRLDLSSRKEREEPVTVTTVTAGTHATEARARLPEGTSLLGLLGLLVPIPMPAFVENGARKVD
jgi:trehalose-phosphatase